MHLLSGLNQENGGCKEAGRVGTSPDPERRWQPSVQCGSAGCPRPSSHEQKQHLLQARSTGSICVMLPAKGRSPRCPSHALPCCRSTFSAELNEYWLHLLTTNNPAGCIYCHATDIIMLSCPLEEATAKTQSFRFFHVWKK